jgi:hypothetical protein
MKKPPPHLTIARGYGKISFQFAPVAQRIEHRPPKPGAPVRVGAGVLACICGDSSSNPDRGLVNVLVATRVAHFGKMTDDKYFRQMYADASGIADLPDELVALLPRGKDDLASVQLLQQRTPDELEPITLNLLKWLQDANWPIARHINEVLLTFGKLLIEPIHQILNTNDDIWKTNVIRCLILPLHEDLLESLSGELRRIADSPTRGELLEDTAEAAQEVLKNH